MPERPLDARGPEGVDEVVRQAERNHLGDLQLVALETESDLQKYIKLTLNSSIIETLLKRQFMSTWTVSPLRESYMMFSVCLSPSPMM